MEPTRAVPVEMLLAHRGFVHALARRLAADDAGADEVEQTAWLAAIERPPRHDRGLRGWLARLVRHRAADARRAQGRRARHESAAVPARSVASPPETAARLDAMTRVVAAVARLPEPYRTTVVLRFYDDLPVAEIAVRMDVPPATVRTRLTRAYARLREELGISDESRDEWLALLVPWLGVRRWTRAGAAASAAGAIVMSAKTWAAAAAVVAIAAGAMWWTNPSAAPRTAPHPDERDVAAAPRVRTPSKTHARAAPAVVPADPVPAEPTGSLVVSVRTFRDEPIAGAVVELRRDSPGAPAADTRLATDDDGVARFTGLPAGLWSIDVRANLFAEANASVVVPAGSARKRTVYLDRGHELRGTVRDEAGAPVAGAFVDCVRTRPRPVTTDAAGSFVLSGLASGEVQLRAGRSKDALIHRQIVAIPEVSAIDVVLVDIRTVTVTGTAVDDASGAPIEGVAVGNAVAGPPPVVTGADGRFRLAGVGRDLLEVITLTKDGYRRFPAQRAAVRVPDGAESVDVGTLRMQRGATIEGTVTSPEGPIEGAEVIVVSPSRLTGSERRSARTDAAGRYAFASVEAGPTQFWATAPGFIAGEQRACARSVQVPESGTLRADFAFTRGAVVEGRVLDDEGAAVPGAYVVTDGVQVTTGADGGFRLAGLVPRAGVRVLVMADGFMRADTKLDVGPGTTSDAALRVERAAIVRGRLVPLDGRAVADARVIVVAGEARDPARTTENEPAGGPYPVHADGSFEGRVPGSASKVFTVVALTASHAPFRSAPVTLVTGQREYAGIEVVLDAGRTIRGRVVADGRGVAGAAIRLGFAGYGYTAPPVRAVSDDTGAFAIDRVVPSFDGTIWVTATLAGYVDARASPAPGFEGEVTLVLERPLEISGVVESGDHVRSVGVYVKAEALHAADPGHIPPPLFSFTDAAGCFRIPGLRAGKYRVTVVRPGKPPVVREAEAGTQDLTLVLDP
jgi:RNA polymerase sigma-70 factor (ECF subfamily)